MDCSKETNSVFLNLWFDGVFFAVIVEPSDVNFNIKMSNVTHNCIFSHRHEMFLGDDVTTASRRDKNMSFWSCIFHGRYFVTWITLKVRHKSMSAKVWGTGCSLESVIGAIQEE